MIQQKRFWKAVAVVPAGDGFAIELDGRGVKTPAKTPLIVPTEALGNRIAAEWDAIEAEIDPGVMPATRLANSAVDKVAPQRHAVVGMLAEYATTDLLCYRADGPDGLVARQAELWDPVLDWVRATYGVEFAVTSGVLPIPQSPEALAAIADEIAQYDPFALAALHEMITITGSALLGLAIMSNHLSARAAWVAARVDENWQADQWGRDDEAEALAARKENALLFASEFAVTLGYTLLTET